MVTSNESENLSLSEAAKRFLFTLPNGERAASQQEIHKFVRWFGAEHALTGLTGAEVAHYAERLSLSDADYATKLDRIRIFLAYAKKEGWSKTNLATHLKARKDKLRRESLSRQATPEMVLLTSQGYADLGAELATLKSKRLEVIGEIRRAAADKDFRENVPLHAAREQHSHIEGRILELEKTLKLAAIIEEQERSTLRGNVGNTVTLYNFDSGEEVRYMLVSPREVDPVRGRISSASPIGKAIIGRRQGEIIEVVAPAGKLRYQIKQVER